MNPGSNANLALSVQTAEPAPPISTAVIGAGYFGRRHALCYARLAGSELQALVDPDPATQSLAEHLGVAWYSHIADLPPTVRAVSIATPVASHYTLAKTLLERGLDVLLEKPIAETAAQAIELQMLAKTKSCVLQIGHIERFNPAFKTGPALLPRAHAIRTTRTTQRPPRVGALDVVIDLMIHDLDLILYGVACPLDDLHASGCSHGLTPIDEAQVELVFVNGCRAHLRAHWSCAGREDRYMIAELGNSETWMMDFNRRASFRITPSDSIHSLGSDRNPDLVPVAHSSQGLQHNTPNDTLSLQLASFLDASRHRAIPRVTPEDGYAALGLVQQIRQRILEPKSGS